MDNMMERDEALVTAAPETAAIGKEQLRKAMETLERYRRGKSNLDKRIIDNEQFWKMRHWEQMGASPAAEPSSGWLVNVVLNRHADAMDNYPEPNCLPRAADDQEEARRLSKILPVILKQNHFRRTYSDVWWYKLKSGCGVYGVFWDNSKLNGLGDISIRKCDILNLFWEPGVTDIQESENFFQVELVDNTMLESRYPQLKGKLKHQGELTAKFRYDDTVDTSGKSSVIDWYYKKREGNREVLHYCKFVGEEVLYATENDTAVPLRQEKAVDERGYPVLMEVPAGESNASRGWYDHGKYPFVFDTLFPEEGMPCGFGYVDICKSPQKQIDLMNRAILKNTLAAATPRYFIRSDGAVNEEEFADWTRPFIHTSGNLGQDSILQVQTAQLNDVYVAILNNKIQELRETSGNTESATGVASASVTAASAIAALQEASGKLSRDMIDTTYDAYEQVALLAIDLIRQFYSMPRMFRITGEMGRQEFAYYDNRQLQPQEQIGAGGTAMGYRTPIFDIEVVPQNESRYNKAEYNNLALQLYSAGMFNPQMADQSLTALSMMDFKGKEQLQQRLEKNGTLQQQVVQLQQQVMQLAQLVDSSNGTQLAESFAGQVMGQTPPEAKSAGEVKKDAGNKEESGVTANARAKAQRAAQPR